MDDIHKSFQTGVLLLRLCTLLHVQLGVTVLTLCFWVFQRTFNFHLSGKILFSWFVNVFRPPLLLYIIYIVHYYNIKMLVPLLIT